MKISENLQRAKGRLRSWNVRFHMKTRPVSSLFTTVSGCSGNFFSNIYYLQKLSAFLRVFPHIGSVHCPSPYPFGSPPPKNSSFYLYLLALSLDFTSERKCVLFFSDDMVISVSIFFCKWHDFIFCACIIFHCLYTLHHLYSFIILAIGNCAGAVTVHTCLCVMLRSLWPHQRWFNCNIQ